MAATATVSEKGQITLPKQLRDRLGILPGSRLEFRVTRDGNLQVHVLATGSAALAGLLSRPGEPTRSIADMEDAIARAVLARARPKQ